jgi:hypothetical protein
MYSVCTEASELQGFMPIQVKWLPPYDQGLPGITNLSLKMYQFILLLEDMMGDSMLCLTTVVGKHT